MNSPCDGGGGGGGGGSGSTFFGFTRSAFLDFFFCFLPDFFFAPFFWGLFLNTH